MVLPPFYKEETATKGDVCSINTYIYVGLDMVTLKEVKGAGCTRGKSHPERGNLTGKGPEALRRENDVIQLTS